MMLHRTALVGGIALLALAITAVPTPALAEDVGGLEDAPFIRKQLILRGERHQVTAGLGISLDDPYARGWAPTLGYTFYMFNWFGMGIDVGYNVCQFMGNTCRTGLADEIDAIPAERRTGDVDEIEAISYMVTPSVTLVPLTGKIGLLGTTIINWDMHLTIGGALVGTQPLGGAGQRLKADNKIAPVFGIGQRFYVSDSMAVTLSLRDFVLQRQYTGTGVDESGEGNEEIENRFYLTVSATFFLPPQVKTDH